MYRYFRGANVDHFYTTNANEIGTTTPGQVGNHGYRCEGIAFYVYANPGPGRAALYRYWHSGVNNHFYTTNANEIGTTTPGQVGRYGYKSEGITGYVMTSGTNPVFRYFYGGSNANHFYTQNANEIGTFFSGQEGRYGYRSEGIGFYSAPGSPPTPKVNIYRYFRGANVDHFYTANPKEIGTTTQGQVGNHGYRCEGVGFQCYPNAAPGRLPLYRYWNSAVSDHFYTTNANEIGTTTPGQVGRHGYRSEGITCFVVTSGTPVYRYYLGGPNANHFYTQNAGEIGTTTPGQRGNHGYVSEGIGFRSA